MMTCILAAIIGIALFFAIIYAVGLVVTATAIQWRNEDEDYE